MVNLLILLQHYIYQYKLKITYINHITQYYLIIITIHKNYIVIL